MVHRIEMGNAGNKNVRRFCFWAAIVLYTAALPYANFVYLFIVDRFSRYSAGKIPLVLVVFLGVAYLWAGFRNRRMGRSLLFFLPCVVISCVVIMLEPNPNKHIHIPEYVLMTWLVYEALILDYEGGGLLALVFVFSSMLGVLDELCQGILPERFYSLNDMAVNAAASLIGVLALAGLKPVFRDHGEWTGVFKNYSVQWVMIILGGAGAVVMCTVLAGVIEEVPIYGIYPVWLNLWNILFALAGLLLIVIGKPLERVDRRGINQSSSRAMSTYLLTVLPLAVLVVMHALMWLTALMGWDFL